MCLCLSYVVGTCSFVRDSPRICLRQTLGPFGRLPALSGVPFGWGRFGIKRVIPALFPLLFVILKRNEGDVVVFGLRIKHFAKRLLAYRSELFLLIVVMKHHIFPYLGVYSPNTTIVLMARVGARRFPRDCV